MQERLTPYQIKVQVAREFGVDPSEFDKTCHSRRMVDAKHEAIARIHEAHRDLSLAQIARYFGKLDHTSVINALKRLQAGRFAGSQPRQRMIPRPILTRERARHLYFNEGHSILRMSKDFGRSEDSVRKYFEADEIIRIRNQNYRHDVQASPKVPLPPHNVIASVHHQIDFKRAGHTAEWYRANCEIPAELDIRERRHLARHPRVVVKGHQHGSWMGSPAALCAGAL